MVDIPTFDYSKLEGKIVEKYKTKTNFASALGISLNSLIKKLKNQREFTLSEIIRCKELLELDSIDNYFFKNNV